MMTSLLAAAAALVIQMGGVPVQYTTANGGIIPQSPTGASVEVLVSTSELSTGVPIVMATGSVWAVRGGPVNLGSLVQITIKDPNGTGKFVAKVPASEINTLIWVTELTGPYPDTDIEESTSDTPTPEDPVITVPLIDNPGTPPSTEPVIPTP